MPQIVIHLVLTIPLVVWIMISYFETTPPELEEAALVDGASRWQTFRHVALPVARPGIVVAAILSVIFVEQFRVRHRARRPRDANAAGRRLQHAVLRPDRLGAAGGAAIVVTLPVLLLTVAAQRQIVAGLTAGAVKGG